VRDVVEALVPVQTLKGAAYCVTVPRVTLVAVELPETTVRSTIGGTVKVVVKVIVPVPVAVIVPASMLYGKCENELVKSLALSTLPFVKVTLAVIYRPFHSSSVVCQVVGVSEWLTFVTMNFSSIVLDPMVL
jgi:hypothetical protein